jgi:hypothetical protein
MPDTLGNVTDGLVADCRALLMLLADGMHDDLADLTWTARQLSAELHEWRTTLASGSPEP